MAYTPRHSKRRTISLPPAHDAVLTALAGDAHSGNVSRAIARLIETHPVTKSAIALPIQATRAA